MVTVEQIYDEFPEFARTSRALVQAKLSDAELLTGGDYAAESRDMRVKYLTVELLVLSPGGEFARLDPSKEPDGARSIYERRRLELDRSFLPLAMVL
jgi:hypothetical protein